MSDPADLLPFTLRLVEGEDDLYDVVDRRDGTVADRLGKVNALELCDGLNEITLDRALCVRKAR